MGNELESIAQITSTGDLRAKLIETEGAKVEIEANLLKCVRFILLTSIPILTYSFDASYSHFTSILYL